MIIEVRPGDPSTVAMREHGEFRHFHVAVVGQLGLGEVRKALARHDVEVDGGHAWVPEDTILALAGSDQPPDWRTGLDAMIRYAQENGWVDEAGRVRAHIEPSKG